MNEEKEITITISDPDLGERTLEPGMIGLIKDQHRLLCKWRDERSSPSKDLLDDIAVYEFILQHPTPEVVASAYMDEMDKQRQKHGFGVKKMKVAKMLGWFQ